MVKGLGFRLTGIMRGVPILILDFRSVFFYGRLVGMATRKGTTEPSKFEL